MGVVQNPDGVLAYRCHHSVEHVKALHAVGNDGVVVSIGAERYSLLELVHVVDMLHPLSVHDLQKRNSLHLAHDGRGELLFLFLISLERGFGGHLDDILLADIVELGKSEVKVVRDGEQPREVLAQSGKVPVLLLFADKVALHAARHKVLYHLYDVIVQVLALKNLGALAVDYLSLSVHYVVIVEYVLSYVEVSRLDLSLGGLYDIGEHPRLYGHVLIDAQSIHHGGYPVAAEKPHQIVLKREEEAALALVSLSAGTSS